MAGTCAPQQAVDTDEPMDYAADYTDTTMDVGEAVEPTDALLIPPPTKELTVYEPFVRWLLQASLEELSSLHGQLPDELFFIGGAPIPIDQPTAARSERFGSLSEYKYARAAVEAELEDVWDELSLARREWNNIDDKLLDLREEREDSKEQIALLESRLSKLLQDRDLAIAQKYTTEKQIRDAEQFKAQQQQQQPQQQQQSEHPPVHTRSNSLLGFIRRGSSAMGLTHTKKDVERLQKEIADAKVETALAKTDLDTHYYRLRQIEKKCAAVKLEIAQVSALEDDLQALLLQLTRERRFSAEQLQQISTYSAAAAAQLKPSDPVFN